MIYKHIHFIGIGGISQSALAYLLASTGYEISGSDLVKSNLTEKLEKMGVKVYYNHSAENVSNADIVVATSAAHSDNPELQEAKNRGILVISRAELLGEIAKGYKKVISVAGTHGKTTTTGMLATIFIYAGKNPTVHIGGELPIINGNVHVGSNSYFITEACEYCDSFLTLNSYASVVLNVQKDHLDYFKNMNNLKKSFKQFVNNTISKGYTVINCDDNNCNNIKNKNLNITFGQNGCGVIEAKNITSDKNQCYNYDLVVCGINLARIELSVSGKHNIYNSLAAISVALKEGIQINIIKFALANYKASMRRFQFVSHYNGAIVIHDYAHHPTEIKANLITAKNMCKNKLHIVFEPHTYSRTKYLWQDFVNCFKGTDTLIIPPIYAAREEPIANITNQNLVKAIAKTGVNAIKANSLSDAYSILKNLVSKGDIVLLLGAGTIENMCEMFTKK